MEEDLRAMMCADSLATARSTLVCLTTYHTRAERIYTPVECNSQLGELQASRPDVEVRPSSAKRRRTALPALWHAFELTCCCVDVLSTVHQAPFLLLRGVLLHLLSSPAAQVCRSTFPHTGSVLRASSCFRASEGQ